MAVICGNAHGAHDGVIAKDAAEVVGIWENIFLQRQKHARGIDQINRGYMIVDGNILRADDFLCREREERSGLHRGVVHDEHHQAAADPRQPRNNAGRRRSAPFLIHLVRGVDSQLEKRGVRIDQPGDAFARRQAALFVLGFDGFGAAALLNFGFLILDLGDQVDHAARILLEVRRVAFDLGVDNGTRQGRLLLGFIRGMP